MKFGIFLILNFDTLGSEKVKIQKRGLLTENVSGGSETTASNTQRNMKSLMHQTLFIVSFPVP